MKNKIKLAILDLYNGEENQGMVCLKNLANNYSKTFDYNVFEVRQKNEIPNLENDVFIFSGGPGSPEKSGHAWEKSFYKLIEDIFAWNRVNDKKKFAFLICHSFQMLALHLELAEVSKRRKKAFGVMSIYKTVQGISDFILNKLPNPFFGVDSREYQLLNPNDEKMKEIGAEVVCLEKTRNHVPLPRALMAIRFTKEVFGTQFHPEANPHSFSKYLKQPKTREHFTKIIGDRKYNKILSQLLDENKILKTFKTVLPTFLEDAAMNIIEKEETYHF